MTKRELKHFQADRARMRANRKRLNMWRRNQPRVRGPLDVVNVARSKKSPMNVIEMWARQAVQIARSKETHVAAEAAAVGVIMVIVTGCTPY